MNHEIRRILGRVGRLSMPVAAVGDQGSLRDAGLSSFAAVELMLALEDEFGIEFPDEMITSSRFSSIAAIAETVGVLAARRAAEAAAPGKAAFTTSPSHR